MTKYLIDASIIASSLEDFKRRFVSSLNSTLVLSDLTYRELELRKVDKVCPPESQQFTRFLIDLFVRDTSTTEVCKIDHNGPTKHIDENLVNYAQSNNYTILTSDKGMALWCRFYQVQYELLEIRSAVNLPFVLKNDGSMYMNLFDKTIPRGYRVFVYAPATNRIMSPLENGVIFLNPGNILLVAHPEKEICGIDTYYVTAEKNLNMIAKDFYSSEEDIDADNKPFHIDIYRKWVTHMQQTQN